MKFDSTATRRFLALAAGATAMCLFLATGAAARYHHLPWPDNLPSYQYMNIGPLPGDGMAINSSGQPDGQGALQINIPVAYTPRSGYLSASAYKGRHPGRVETDNGSGILAMGFGGYPSIYVSGMQVSHILKESKAVSVQISLLRETPDHPALCVGVQDALGKEANGVSRYFAATKALKFGETNAYVTVGYGGGRFLKQPFGGVSVPLGQSFNVVTEYDGYQFNNGVAWRPGGRNGWLTILGGYNGKTGWMLGAGTAFNLNL